MRYTTIAIIYNPNSTGSSELLARQFEEVLHKRLPTQKIELIRTEHAGHGEELAYRIASSQNNTLIVSSSGDGGYHDVINGVMKAQNAGHYATTGLLPAGNANDHYHNLHSKDLIEQIIDGDEPTKIDLLKLISTSKAAPIERYAHSYIGFGLTPVIGNELNKTKLNPFNEFWIVARSLFTIKPVRLEVYNKVRHYESIVFSNVDVMSKYLKISQPSSVSDGKFEVTIFRRRNKLKLILLLLKTSFKGVKEDTKVREFLLKTVYETLVQTDGEIIELDAQSAVSIVIESQVLACVV